MPEAEAWDKHPILDVTTFDGLKAVLEDSMNDVVDEFINDSGQLIRGIKEALPNEERAQIARFAHQLKSSSAALGGMRSHHIADHIEQTALNLDIVELQRDCELLSESVNELVTALNSQG